MGRARGHSLHAAATASAFGRFDAVLGARRGSVAAQIQRDAEESEAHEAALREMMLAVNDSNVLSERSDKMIATLARAYRAGEHQQDSPGYERLRQELDKAFVDYSHRSGIMQVVAHGDPPGWPGLTAPAVHELGSILSTSSGGDGSLDHAAYALTRLFNRKGYDDEHYQRLSPVLDGLAAILRNVPLDLETTPCVQMATLLRRAPTKMLSGPLQPLVQAFAQRAEEGELTTRERVELNEVQREQTALPESEREAFLPVVKALAGSRSHRF